MKLWIAWGLLAFGLCSFALSCGGKQGDPEVPEGKRLCKYCCTTANNQCSCIIPEVVECPEPDKTGTLQACAECRSCTKKLGADESCNPDD